MYERRLRAGVSLINTWRRLNHESSDGEGKDDIVLHKCTENNECWSYAGKVKGVHTCA